MSMPNGNIATANLDAITTGSAVQPVGDPLDPIQRSMDLSFVGIKVWNILFPKQLLKPSRFSSHPTPQALMFKAPGKLCGPFVRTKLV
jgi:hypothetical protein